MTKEPKKFKTKVEHEIIRFLENENVSIDEFCIRCNEWRMKRGLLPIKKTPYKKMEIKK